MTSLSFPQQAASHSAQLNLKELERLLWLCSQDHCYYHGHVVGVDDSSASVALCSGIKWVKLKMSLRLSYGAADWVWRPLIKFPSSTSGGLFGSRIRFSLSSPSLMLKRKSRAPNLALKCPATGDFTPSTTINTSGGREAPVPMETEQLSTTMGLVHLDCSNSAVW